MDFFGHLRPVCVRASAVNVQHVRPVYVGHVRPVYVWPRAAGLCLATCGRFMFGHVRLVYVWPRAAGVCLAMYGRFMFGHLRPVYVDPVRLDELQELCQRGWSTPFKGELRA